MIIIIVENVSESLRGEISKYLLEVKAGVFIGKISKLVRDNLWASIKASVPVGGALIAYSMNNEQGFTFESYGELTRKTVDYDGLTLLYYESDSKKDTKTLTKLKHSEK